MTNKQQQELAQKIVNTMVKCYNNCINNRAAYLDFNKLLTASGIHDGAIGFAYKHCINNTQDIENLNYEEQVKKLGEIISDIACSCLTRGYQLAMEYSKQVSNDPVFSEELKQMQAFLKNEVESPREMTSEEVNFFNSLGM